MHPLVDLAKALTFGFLVLLLAVFVMPLVVVELIVDMFDKEKTQ